MGFIIMTVLRLVLPLVILRYPLVGGILAMLLDALDWHIVRAYPGFDHGFYQLWDKSLDSYYLMLELLVVLTWQNSAVRRISLSLFALRMVGVFLFLITQHRLFLFFFPNLFESFFIFVLVYPLLQQMKISLPKLDRVYGYSLIGLLVPKMAIEYNIHIANITHLFNMFRHYLLVLLPIAIIAGFFGTKATFFHKTKK